MSHIMLDLETFGTKPGSVIRSIGAVVFTLDGVLGGNFYANIDHQSCLAAGLTVNPATEAWWAGQSQEARDALLVNPKPIAEVVGSFAAWFQINAGRHVWCQGANFDAPLWEAVCEACGSAPPWKFFDVRDTRTAYTIGNFNPSSIKREGTYHNALADAQHQVRCVAKAIQMSKRGMVSLWD